MWKEAYKKESEESEKLVSMTQMILDKKTTA